jgi:hypothetical protein
MLTPGNGSLLSSVTVPEIFRVSWAAAPHGTHVQAARMIVPSHRPGVDLLLVKFVIVFFINPVIWF